VISIDSYLGRRFDRERYNCLHFTCEVWLALTRVDITEKLAAVLNPSKRVPSRKLFRGFTQLDKPQSPCLVFMQRAHCAPHIGIYFRGKVLHLHEMGVEFQPVEVAMRGFTGVRYYV
jgi:hypothetical protein